MDDNWTRENRIKKMSLKTQIYLPYFTVLAIFTSVFTYILTMPQTGLEKMIMLVIPFLGTIFTGFALLGELSELNEIFEN
jgi:hypothetical protein